MARIPIAQIPNAPQLAQPVVTPTGAPRVSLMAAAQKLQQESMPLDSFSGAAKGLEALGEAGQRVSAVLQDFSMRMSQANDVAATSEAEMLLSDKYGSLQAEMEKTSVDQWPELVKVRLPEWKKEIDDIPMSSGARTSLERYYRQFADGLTVDVRTRANTAVIQKGRQTLMANVDRRIGEQDHVGARKVLQTGVDAGLLAGTEAQVKSAEIDGNEMDMRVQDWIAQDPHVAAQSLRTESTGFLHLDQNPRLKARYAQIANDKVFELTEAATNTLEQGIDSGEISDETQLQRLAVQARLPKEEVESLSKSMKLSAPTSPEGKAIYLGQQSTLLTTIQKYDPALDDDKSGYRAIRRQVREQILPADRAAYLESLNKIMTQGSTVTNRARADIYGRIDFLAQQEQMGTFRNSGGEMDFEKEQTVWRKAIQLKRDADEYLKITPNPTPDEINSWLNPRIRDTARKLGAQDSEPPMPMWGWNRDMAYALGLRPRSEKTFHDQLTKQPPSDEPRVEDKTSQGITQPRKH